MDNIKSLLDHYDAFVVPTFQRAYSWDKLHYERFWQDLQEAVTIMQGERSLAYYYGHFLILKDGNSTTAQLVDGQQRLTTLMLFFASIINNKQEQLDASWRLRIQATLAKFSTVDYDQEFFAELIVGKNSKKAPVTLSASRLQAAYKYFSEQVNQQTDKDLLAMLEVMTQAQITVNQLTNRTQATHIFTFQNDRGKALTELEKIKAFIAFQYYRHAADAQCLETFYERFTAIYKNIEQIKIGLSFDDNIENDEPEDGVAKLGLNEDQVLMACLDAFYFHFEKNKRSFEQHFDDYKQELAADAAKSPEEQRLGAIAYLNDFTQHLEKAFRALLAFSDYLKGDGQYSLAKSVTILPKAGAFYPFFLLQNELELFDKNNVSLNYQQLFFAFEQLLLRVNAVEHSKQFDRGYLRDWLRWWRKSPHGSASDYVHHFLNRLYINSFGVEDAWQHPYNIGESVIYYHLLTEPRAALVRYLLWRWELQLRAEEGIQPIRWEDMPKSIEHIGPQSLESKRLEGYDFSGLDVKKKKKEDWGPFYKILNGWGNFTLVSQSLNSAMSNKPFREKQEITHAYINQNKHPQLVQYRAIFVDYGQPRRWTKTAIEERRAAITAFIEDNFLKEENWLKAAQWAPTQE